MSAAARRAKRVTAVVEKLKSVPHAPAASDTNADEEKNLFQRLTWDECAVLYAIQGVTRALSNEIHGMEPSEDESNEIQAGLVIALEFLADVLPGKL